MSPLVGIHTQRPCLICIPSSKDVDFSAMANYTSGIGGAGLWQRSNDRSINTKEYSIISYICL